MILVRHAESEWNERFSQTKVDPGIPDPALTARGRTQAAALAGKLAAAGVARLIVSPYRRALETAAIVVQSLGLPVTIEPLVRERCFFSCDIGSQPADLSALWPALDFAHLSPHWWGQPPESEAALAERCAQFRHRTAALADLAQVAVITHWGFIRAFSGQEVPNATLVRWLADGPPVLLAQP
jgi:broad specificity phosphatase PhoE